MWRAKARRGVALCIPDSRRPGRHPELHGGPHHVRAADDAVAVAITICEGWEDHAEVHAHEHDIRTAYDRTAGHVAVLRAGVPEPVVIGVPLHRIRHE